MPFDSGAAAKATLHAQQLKIRLEELTVPLLADGRKGKMTAMQLANAVLVLRDMRDTFQAAQDALDQAYDAMTKEVVPAAFEREEATTLTIKAGYRITISQRYYASIIPDKKADAYKWLRANKLDDLIQETVNASTLSAAGKELLETKGKELPEGMFNCHFQPNTSITKVPNRGADARPNASK
jgi:hypothetical protein